VSFVPSSDFVEWTSLDLEMAFQHNQGPKLIDLSPIVRHQGVDSAQI
jgi:hypothetical protein